MIDALCTQTIPDVMLEGIFHDIAGLVKDFCSVSFSHVPRCCNMAAHDVAGFAAKVGGAYVWHGWPPFWLSPTLATGVNLPLR